MHALRLAELIETRPELRRFVSVTSQRADGAGSQAQSMLSALLFAHAFGVGYVHSPIRRIYREKNPRKAGRAWERFLNLGAGEAVVSADRELVRLREYVGRPDDFLRPIVVTAKQFYRPAALLIPGGYERIAALARSRYDARDRSKIALHRTAGALRLAVHIRRGDLIALGIRHRLTPDERVLQAIDRAKALFPSQELRINVYSEGERSDFEAFSKAGCHLYLGASPFVAFHNMVVADVLIPARSCFSYVAALLSRGTVLYEPWNHAPRTPEHPARPGWIRLTRAPD